LAVLISARSESDASRQYIAPLQRAVSAFAENAFLLRTAQHPILRAHGLRLTGRRVAPLRDAAGRARLALRAELYFRPVLTAEAPQRWTVETAAYIIQLDDGSSGERPILSYHWHPHIPGIGFQHVHLLAATPELGRLHISTPPCTLLHVLTFAVRDFDVRPIRADWRGALEQADGVLQASMEWASGAALYPPNE
jgi:hypothetical protein